MINGFTMKLTKIICDSIAKLASHARQYTIMKLYSYCLELLTKTKLMNSPQDIMAMKLKFKFADRYLVMGNNPTERQERTIFKIKK